MQEDVSTIDVGYHRRYPLHSVCDLDVVDAAADAKHEKIPGEQRMKKNSVRQDRQQLNLIEICPRIGEYLKIYEFACANPGVKPDIAV